MRIVIALGGNALLKRGEPMTAGAAGFEATGAGAVMTGAGAAKTAWVHTRTHWVHESSLGWQSA